MFHSKRRVGDETKKYDKYFIIVEPLFFILCFSWKKSKDAKV